MTVECVQETTKWNESQIGYCVKNHIYLLSGSKAYAYWKVGDSKPTYFKKPFLFETKNRTFREIPNIFDMSEVVQ